MGYFLVSFLLNILIFTVSLSEIYKDFSFLVAAVKISFSSVMGKYERLFEENYLLFQINKKCFFIFLRFFSDKVLHEAALLYTTPLVWHNWNNISFLLKDLYLYLKDIHRKMIFVQIWDIGFIHPQFLIFFHQILCGFISSFI